ncbi:tetratricopeptide repeat protein [Patescibacteria group bacterium]|nr:tetratricopeptide repeat protein [Patescibacteria group bacterium]
MKKNAHTTIIRTILLLDLVFVVIIGIGVATVLIVRNATKGVLDKSPQYTSQQLYENAVQQVDKGSYSTAENYLEQALLKEDNATYRSELAVVKYRLKEYDQAIAEYEKLVNKKQDPAFAWNGIGNAYRDWAGTDAAHKSQYLQQAEYAYRQAIQADPKYTAAYSNLALLLQNKGDTAGAKTVLNQGISQTSQPELTTLLHQLH